ncbi:MAG TPA: metal ABC transporter permease [Candidatus Margulisiibacteriota bacterium]|nr:metal ABC transporter permease [Candidatus Margulisiibacteriota bacterium]
MTEVLGYAFVQRALIAGILVGLLCGVLGFFVVLKRLSFIGVGISHSAFGGIAIGVLAGVEPLLAAAGFSTAVAWAIGWLSRKGRLHEDTAIGILFSSAMALGVALISLSSTYQVDLFGYLFGNILAVSASDLWLLGSIAMVVLGVVGLLFKELLFLAFDEEVARANGLPVTALYFVLLGCLALAVVAAIRVVGIVLVEALLVIPAAIGYQLAHGYRAMLCLSVAAAVLSAVVGLFVSYFLNVAAGATIVLVLTVLFVAALAIGHLRRAAPARRLAVAKRAGALP